MVIGRLGKSCEVVEYIVLTIEIFPAAAGSRAGNLKTIIYNPNRGNFIPLRV